MHRRNVLFPEPDGPDEAQHLAPGDRHVDALQDLEAAVGLVDAPGLHHQPTARPRPVPAQSWGATQGASAMAGTGRVREWRSAAVSLWKGVGGS